MPHTLVTRLIAAGVLVLSGLVATTHPAGADPGQAAPGQTTPDDPAARVGPGGRVYYVDPPASQPPATTGSERRILPRRTAQVATVPAMSSLPGSRRTVHLDFDGRDVTGSAWEDVGITGFRSGFNLEGPASDFSPAEVAAIREIWERVAEVYAPFDVNVTTVDPGEAAINRSDPGDLNFGVRMVITHDPDPHQKVCGGGCGGVAFLDVFDDDTANAYRLGWVFPDGAFNDPGLIAHSTSHEVGHTLSLEHDGHLVDGDYYFGTAIWGPLMGGGSGSAVVQFSRGDYPAADNFEDDLALVASRGLALRPDIGNTAAAAHDLGSSSTYSYAGRINSPDDVDVVRFAHACTTPIAITATGPELGQTLDISLTLRDANQTVIATANPPAVSGGAFVASGMDASLTVEPTNGPYYLSIDGVSAGTPPNGWTDYGSIGSYALSIASCDGVIPPVIPPVQVAPGPPTSLRITAGVRRGVISWVAPVDAGTSPVTGYQVSVGSTSASFDATTTSVEATGLADARTYPVTVRAVSAHGASVPASGTLRTPGKPGRTPIGLASSGAKGGKATATARWRAATANGSAITHYRVRATLLNKRNQAIRHRWSATVSPRKRSLVMRLPKGRYRFTVVASNRVGNGQMSKSSRIVTSR